MPNQYPMFSKENYNLEARTKYEDAQRKKMLDERLQEIAANADAETKRQIQVERERLNSAKNLVADREKLAEEKRIRERNEMKTGLAQAVETEWLRQQQPTGYRFPGTKALAEQHSEHMMREAEALPALKDYNATQGQMGTKDYAKDIAEALGALSLTETKNKTAMSEASARRAAALEQPGLEAELATLLGKEAVGNEIAGNPSRYASPAVTGAEIRANAQDGDNPMARELAEKWGLGNKGATPASPSAPPARIKLDALSVGGPPTDPGKATLPLPPSAPGPANAEGKRTSPLGGETAALVTMLETLLQQLKSANSNAHAPAIAR